MIFIALVCCLGLSAFISASEASLFSLSSLQLKGFLQGGSAKEKLAARLLKHPRDLLVTLLIVNILANILVQNAVSTLFEAHPGWLLRVGVPFLLTIVCGELMPKSIALSHNVKIAPVVSPAISFVFRLLWPARRFLIQIAQPISRFLFFFVRSSPPPSAIELRELLRSSEESGVVLREERRLIEGALRLEQTPVKEHMRPRGEVRFYRLTDPLDALVSLFVESQLSRVPVAEQELEGVAGILERRDFLFSREAIERPQDLLPLLKKPYFAPETMSGFALLEQMRQKREPLALIVDEYGSIAGLVSQEDLVEAVIGEISDPRDLKPLYTRSGSDVIIASGKLELKQFEELFSVRLPSETRPVTIGGWLIEQLGEIPAAGTKYATDQFLFYVLAAEPNRIRRIYARKLAKKGGKGR